MPTKTCWLTAVVCLGALVISSVAQAGFQPAAAESPPATQAVPEQAVAEPDVAPAPDNPAGTEALAAEVVEVRGAVERSKGEAATPDAAEWVPLQAGEKLGGGVLVRTGLRSHLILKFGDNSVVMITRSTLASIKQFYRDSTTETVRLGLGYGAIRGGTTEGTLRSDFVVDSAVATLAKRGTEGWELWQEPYTGRFRISLASEGLVEALERETGDRRLVHPGEYADNRNIAAMWVKQDIFDRNVQFYSAESISATDLEFANNMATGLAVVSPGSGNQTNSVSGRGPDAAGVTGLDVNDGFQLLPPVIVERAPFVIRPEGNFGTGPSFDGSSFSSQLTKSRVRSYAPLRQRTRLPRPAIRAR